MRGWSPGLLAVDAVCRAASTGEGGDEAGRIAWWLRRFYEYFCAKQVLAAELIAQTGEANPIFDTGCRRLLAAGAPLHAAASRAGRIAPELSLEQVLLLVSAVAHLPGSLD